MGIIFFSLIAKITTPCPGCLSLQYLFWQFYLYLKIVHASNSHFIFNNWLLGYCHQSDVSKLPQVISDHCKKIKTE